MLCCLYFHFILFRDIAHVNLITAGKEFIMVEISLYFEEICFSFDTSLISVPEHKALRPFT